MTERMLQRSDAPALRYRDDGGERPPVMLIHSVGADGTSWNQIAPALSPEFRVLRLDLGGHGRSGYIDGALTLEDFVQDVVDVPDAYAVPTPHIVGFSPGGMIRAGPRVAARAANMPAGIARRRCGPHGGRGIGRGQWARTASSAPGRGKSDISSRTTTDRSRCGT
jgi:alpha-beta hydrolase superfamily lysophospholipase